MRFTLRFLPRNTAACALLALAPLAAYSQDAPAPETHGIVVANMDRSVKPGDDFYRYANGDWIRRTEIPPDRTDIGVIDSAKAIQGSSYGSRTIPHGLLKELTTCSRNFRLRGWRPIRRVSL
jgi:hypothetical protein